MVPQGPFVPKWQRQPTATLAVEARETAEKLREKLFACQRDLRSVQDRLRAVTAERRQHPAIDLQARQM